jgi:hypothetical protein
MEARRIWAEVRVDWTAGTSSGPPSDECMEFVRAIRGEPDPFLSRQATGPVADRERYGHTPPTSAWSSCEQSEANPIRFCPVRRRGQSPIENVTATHHRPTNAWLSYGRSEASRPMTRPTRQALTRPSKSCASGSARCRRSMKQGRGTRPSTPGREPHRTVELVDKDLHAAIAHTGPGAKPRAVARVARGASVKTRAIGALSVYLTARDVLQSAGALKPDYDEHGHITYQYVDKDGSEFIVVPGNRYSRPKREFVAGPRKGQAETITDAELNAYRKQGEEEWGKYIPGSLFRDPRFIPGRKRQTLPLFIDDHGVPREAGWIDEKGVHYHSIPRPAVI